MDVSSNLESHDLVLRTGSPKFDPEPSTLQTDLEDSTLTLGSKVSESLGKDPESKITFQSGDNVEKSFDSLSDSLGDKLLELATNSTETDSESTKMLEMSPDLDDVGNNMSGLSSNLSAINSERNLEVPSDLPELELENNQESETLTDISDIINSKSENMSEGNKGPNASDLLSDSDNDLLKPVESSVEPVGLYSAEHFVVEQFSALTENRPESNASLLPRKTEDVSLVAYEYSESESELDCSDTVPQVVNGVNHSDTTQEIQEQSHPKPYEEPLGDFDETEDSCDKEGELQIDESQYEQESSLHSPEIERGKTLDESFNKSQGSIKDIHLEMSVEDGSDDDDDDDSPKIELKAKASPGVVKKGEASVTEISRSLESKEMEKKNQMYHALMSSYFISEDDEIPATKSKEPEVKASSVRHRSQRKSVSSGSSCPCCVETTKHTHTSGSKAVTAAHTSSTKTTPPAHTSSSKVVAAHTSGSKAKTTPTAHTGSSKASPSVMDSPPSTSKVKTPKVSTSKKSCFPVGDDDPLAQPFRIGWRREVVVRSTSDGKRPQSDVYYFAPTGRKLRSMPEILKYVSEHPDQGFNGTNFSFTKEAVYHPPGETVRSAHQRPPKTSPGSSEKQPSAKKIKPALKLNQDGHSLDQNTTTPKNEDYLKRQRKPKMLPDYVVSVPSPQSSSSSCEKWAENTAVRRKSVDIKEEPVVISRSGRRIKARNLEIVEQMQVGKTEDNLSREIKHPKVEQEVTLLSVTSVKTDVQPFTPKNMNLETSGLKMKNLEPFPSKMKSVLSSKLKQMEPVSPLKKILEKSLTKMKNLEPSGPKMKNLEPKLKNTTTTSSDVKKIEPSSGQKTKIIETSGPKAKSLETPSHKTKSLETPSHKTKSLETPSPKTKSLETPCPKTKNLETSSKTKNLEPSIAKIKSQDSSAPLKTKNLESSGTTPAHKVESSGPKMKNLDSPDSKTKNVESSGPKMKNLDTSGSKPKRPEHSGPRMRNLHSSPNRKEKEVSTPNRKEKEISSPNRKEKEISSPNRKEKEISSPNRKEKEVPKSPKIDTTEEPMSPERPKRNIAKRKYDDEYPLGIFEDMNDDDVLPIPSPKKTPPSPNKIPKITAADGEKPKEIHKGKENAPNSAIEQLFGESLASVKSPKINFTFSKFTKRVNNSANAVIDKAHGAPCAKKAKTDKSCSVNDRLCSLSCPGRKCSLPTLHCDVCLCLFHPECMGFLKGAPKKFTCSWCKKEPVSKDAMSKEEKKTESLNNKSSSSNSVQPEAIKNGLSNMEELEDNDIASDDDVDFLPMAPEVVFSQQVNHNVPVVQGLAFMRKPPPLTRAPVAQNLTPIRPAKPVKSPVSTLLVSNTSQAQTQLLPPYGVASSTLRTIANLAQASPQQITGLVSAGGQTFLLPTGPRPSVPGTASAIQVPVPGVTKGTVIYTNNPNLRFILTPSITTTTTIGSPSPPVLPGPASVATEVITVTSAPQVLVSSVSKEPSPSTSKATSPTVVKEASPPLPSPPPPPPPKVQEPPPPPPPPPPRPPTPPPPPPVHVPDPEPIVIDMKETSLCDTMLKIKIPEPGSGQKKAKIILKKPESRERPHQIPKPKKRGRVKGSTLRKNEDGSSFIVPPTAEPPAVPMDITICHDVPDISAKTSSVENADDRNHAKQSESKDATTNDASESLNLSSEATTKAQETPNNLTDAADNKVETSEGKEPVITVDSEQKETPVTPAGSEQKEKESTRVLPDSQEPAKDLEDRPFSPLPSIFTEDVDDDENSDADSIESDQEQIPDIPVILREVKYNESARIVTTCLSNRGGQLTSPSLNCARTLRYKRACIDTGWSQEHTYSFSPKQPCMSSTRKTVMTLNLPRRPFHSIQSACDSLHLVFEYLSAQDLIRAGQVCKSWRRLATQPHLWRSVKLKGVCIRDWTTCAKMLEQVKTTYLDLRGMKCKEHMWNQFVGSLYHLRNIEELVFGEVPNFVLTVVASSLSQLQCLEAENIYTDVKSLPYWDPGCVASLQKLSILRMRAPKGVELPRFLPYAGFSAFSQLSYLTHMSLTSFRNCKSADFDFLERMTQLEVLEVGSCLDWDEEAYRRLVKLKSLCRLRLELGGTAADRGLANALTYLSRLEDLTLIGYKITSSLAAAIRRLRNLWHLTLWPDMNSEGGLIVYNTLQAVRSLKKLQSFSWGIIYEDSSSTKYSRHTSKYQESSEVDEWWSEELRKTPHARGIRIPLLKALAEGSKQQESKKNEMQQGLIGVGHLHHKLKRVLPDTDVYLYQVPESLLTKVYGTLR